MYYHGKHWGKIVSICSQWSVVQAELVELAHVSNQANLTVLFFTMFNNHSRPLLCEPYPIEQIALEDDELQSSIEKKTPFSLMYPL